MNFLFLYTVHRLSFFSCIYLKTSSIFSLCLKLLTGLKISISSSLFDLLCLIISFITAYYLKFNSFVNFDDRNWSSLFIIMCAINLIVMFCVNPYKGIKKRRYLLQIKKEMVLFASQVALVCIIFYVLKIGTIFSREMMITTYFLYLISSQILKYFYKKMVTQEISFKNKNKNEVQNKSLKDLFCIKEKTPLRIFVHNLIKRTIDIICGFIGVLILIPLTIIVFVLNRLNDEDGPVFYIQDRIGKNGKIFKMIKYRSMCVDADEKLEAFLEENEDVRKEFHIYRKIKNDPRVTKLGKFLRKTSLDEFPQFINVFIGDMSLVGPRPYLEREKEDMGEYYNIIIKDKPGITGLWQISGRSDVTFEERLKLDLEYNSTKSTLKDIVIILKTFGKVLGKSGAR